MYQTHTDLGFHKKFKKRFKKIRRKLKKVVKKVPLPAFTAGIKVPKKILSNVVKVPKTILKTAIKLNKRVLKTAIKIPVKIISKGSKSVFKLPILLTGATGIGIAAKALRGKKPRGRSSSMKVMNKLVRGNTGITPSQQEKIESIVAERVGEALLKKQKIAPTTVVAPQPISQGSQRFTPAVVYAPGRPPMYINDEGTPTDKSGGMSTAVKVGAVVGAAAIGYLVTKG